MIGDSSVGKSSILLQFVDGTFTSTFISTIGVDFKAKVITLESGETAKLQVWDTAGQERFKTITSSYYRGANAILIVYDVTNLESFENITKWMQEISQHATDTILRILVGNKCDGDKREVSYEDGKALAAEYGILFYETSAKDNINIDETFCGTAELIKEHQ